jgi:galactokinase
MFSTLRDIYGEEADVQRLRYEAALQHFTGAYGTGNVLYFRAPGRVNLIGEHTDYNHGYVMPVALDKDILVLVRPRTDNVVRLSNVEERYAPFSFDIGRNIPSGPRGHWGNYARGVAQEMARQVDRDLRGFDGLVVAQPPYGVPRGVGLSSSSAVTVALAVALAHLNDWQPDGATMARFCSEAEWYVGTRGGIMDQFISILGKRDHALFLDCRPEDDGGYRTKQIPLPRGFSVLIADSGVRHQNVRGGYNHRVAACRAAVQLLQAGYPGITHLRDVQGFPWDAMVPFLPDEITPGELAAQGLEIGDIPGLTPDTALKVRARCRHVWTENHRVTDAVDALGEDDVGRFGRLLNQAHASARDDYEISCPELESLVKTACEVDGVVGARLTGAGWGGCIVAIVKDQAVETFKAHVQSQYPARTGKSTSVFSCRSAPGAGRCQF